MGTKARVLLAVGAIGVVALQLVSRGVSTRSVVRIGAIGFALGSLVIFFSAGGRRHAQPPVPVPTDRWPPEADPADTDE